jgi:hypothetical protein
MFTPIGFFAPQGGQIVTANLEQWLDVTQGSEAGALTDQSGNGRNATNNGLSYDGTNKWWYVSSNSDWTKHIASNYGFANYGGAYNFTIECWVNPTTIVGGSSGMVHNRSGVYGNNFLEIAIDASYRPIFVGIDSSANEAAALSPNSVQNNWVMITGTNDATTTTYSIFVNGVEKDTTDSSILGNVNRAENLSLYGNYLRSTRYIQDAKFGSYRIYSAAHTATEALQNFNAEKSHYGL